MARNYSKILLVTANVGSIFEDPEKMLKMWLKEFLSSVKRLDPDFLALHMQEVGGKNYEESMQHVNIFIKALLASEELSCYDKARLFLDEDFTAVDKFTALGCIYFIHQSVQNVQVWDFHEKEFVNVSGREVLSGNIESVTIKEKAKFPQEFFPDCKWSRKGFIRTRWNLFNTVFDLMNIHLFHDASNIVAMETSPSQYSENRKRVLVHTLERFDHDQYNKVPFVMFGDFNFRLDTKSLIKTLTNQAVVHHHTGKKNDVSKITYVESNDRQLVLTVGKKDFDHYKHSEVFSNNNGEWLHEYDREPGAFKDKLYEYNVTFPPSYPFSEDVEDGLSYMKTRCPSFCDRIMLTHSFRDLLYQEAGPPDYNMMGSNICMGDHKPIYLDLKLRRDTGNSEECKDDVVLREALHKPPLKKVISINGEEVDTESFNEVNIHDFTTFEKEQLLTRKFKSTMRRKSSETTTVEAEGSGPKKVPSFKNLVRNMIVADSVLKALRHYNHRSDSEPSDDEEENDNEVPDQCPVTTVSSLPPELDITPMTSDFETPNDKPAPAIAAESNNNANNNLTKEIVDPMFSAKNNLANDTATELGDDKPDHDKSLSDTPVVTSDIDVKVDTASTTELKTTLVVNNNQNESSPSPMATEEKPESSRRNLLTECCCALL